MLTNIEPKSLRSGGIRTRSQARVLQRSRSCSTLIGATSSRCCAKAQGDWHGQATWLVHFRQRENRPNHMHAYKVGNQIHAVPLKGRAWITADKFQIVRIEAEMLQSMPEIQLISEHQVVEYGPVPFPKKNTTLWLPKSAEIYFDFRKHHYYRRHSFDHFMLYSVESDEKRKEPVAQKSDKKILTQE